MVASVRRRRVARRGRARIPRPALASSSSSSAPDHESESSDASDVSLPPINPRPLHPSLPPSLPPSGARARPPRVYARPVPRRLVPRTRPTPRARASTRLALALASRRPPRAPRDVPLAPRLRREGRDIRRDRGLPTGVADVPSVVRRDRLEREPPTGVRAGGVRARILRCVLYKRVSPIARFQHLIASPFN